jgi:hypothetical protein
MLPNIGQRTDRLPAGLKLVRELEAFEGPILAEYRAESRAVYVEKWCAQENAVSRSVLVRSDQRTIAEFLGGRLPMLDLLKNRSDGIGFLIDRANLQTTAVWLVSIAELPRGYLPRPDRLHDESFRPDWDVVPQSYLVDVDDWDVKMFAAIERNYLNAASFAYHTKPGTQRELPRNILDFRYDGGYSVMHAFNAIRDLVPVEARARPTAVAASSPGVLTLDTPAETSAQLVQAIRALTGSAVAYQAVHDWSRLNMDNVEAVPPAAKEAVERLCRALNVDPGKLYGGADLSEPEAVLVAGKLIAAYYRVLHRVARPTSCVELMGATLDEEPAIPVVDLQEDGPDGSDVRPRKQGMR